VPKQEEQPLGGTLVSDVLRHLQTALADRYHLERELGRGGMATVYLARDLKHKRPVALKVLHAELAATLGPERFEREIETAARLQHPHILSVLDSGDTAGRLWFTMPYVEGESLRDRLRRERQLPLEDALRITREAAQALDYAHRHGVVHRDVKPENLLLTEDGNTLVADFGVARALAGGETQLTETGFAVGTPAYMSPEQASGAPDVDARTDVYALATVLYEMLAGEPPFTGPTPQAIIARRLTETPRQLRQMRETVPETIEQAVAKALAKAPADRFPSAAEFARALAAPLVNTPVSTQPASLGLAAPPSQAAHRRLRSPAAVVALGLGFLIGIGVLFGWLRTHGGGGREGTGVKRLAVLPFENLGDSGDVYFADGVADEVRGKLASLPDVEVIARASSSQYRRSAKPQRQIARELGVRYLLTGTVRWEKRPGTENRVRVSPELVDAASGTTRWQQPFDAPLTDVFRVQADIAERVAQALGVALGAGERQRLAEQPTTNLDAYAHYLKGRELTSGENTPGALRGAAAEYRSAVQLDPAFAKAWAALCAAHADLFRLGGLQVADTRIAREALERATALAPESPDTRLANARYADFVTGNPTAALRELRAGLQVAPRRADLLARAGPLELNLGQVAQGLSDLEQAVRLDPLSPEALAGLAGAYLQLHRLPESEAAITRARALRPSSVALGYQHGFILAAKGDLAGVRRVLQAMEQVLGSRPVVAYVALRENLITLLDSAQLRQLLTLTPADLDYGRADWALALAEGHRLLGNMPKARAYGDTAAVAYAALQRSVGAHLSPDDQAMQYGLRALALAYAGQAVEAAAGVRDAIAASDFWYVRHLAARTYLLSGEIEQAIGQLELLIHPKRGPSYYTGAWLKIDPAFARLRGNSRFEQLVGEK
jgi:TolB-like protein/tRNA A-37 threonylcarbamoyl transferase component Bud32